MHRQSRKQCPWQIQASNGPHDSSSYHESVPKLPHFHHCEEVLCDHSLQKPLLGTICLEEDAGFAKKKG